MPEPMQVLMTLFEILYIYIYIYIVARVRSLNYLSWMPFLQCLYLESF